MSTSGDTLIIKLALYLAPMRLFPFNATLGSHLDTRTRQQEAIEIILGPLEHVEQDWELLTESTHSEHVVSGIPLAVGDQIEHATLVRLVWYHFFHSCVPDSRLSILGTRDEVLGVGGDGASDHLILRQSSKEAFLNAGSSGGFILNQPGTVITRLHEKLIG